MFVGEVCTRDVVIIDKSESAQQAARLMRKHHVGDVVVVEQRQGKNFPVGILTDRDIVVELLAKDVDLNTVSVGDAMSYELLTANEDDALAETLKRLRNKGVRRVPVVAEDGSLEGILTMDDFIDMFAEQLDDLVSLISREQKHEQASRSH
jgi:CBS domain-containing protein